MELLKDPFAKLAGEARSLCRKCLGHTDQTEHWCEAIMILVREAAAEAYEDAATESQCGAASIEPGKCIDDDVFRPCSGCVTAEILKAKSSQLRGGEGKTP